MPQILYQLLKQTRSEIACLEEIAFQQKWIGKKEIKKSILFYGNCDIQVFKIIN